MSDHDATTNPPAPDADGAGSLTRRLQDALAEAIGHIAHDIPPSCGACGTPNANCDTNCAVHAELTKQLAEWRSLAAEQPCQWLIWMQSPECGGVERMQSHWRVRRYGGHWIVGETLEAACIAAMEV